MSGDVITLGNIGNPKHKVIMRHISDVFDNHRGKIDDNIALTTFGNSNSHTILFNTLSPDLDGKQLISVENNDSVLFAPINVKSIVSDNKQNNEGVNILIEKTDKKHVWEATSDSDKIQLLLRLDEGSITHNIEGLSITFADSIRTKYRIGVTMINNETEIVSETFGMDSSFETNNTQFFAFANPVEGATRIVVQIEVVGTNIYEWKLNNITLYSHMNKESLKSLSDLGIITYSEYPNSIMVRKANNAILKGPDMVHKGPPAVAVPIPPAKPGEAIRLPMAKTEQFEHVDSYGTPLIAAPNMDYQYFDNLQPQQMTKIANIKKLYSVTDLKNGRKIYTFDTDQSQKNLTLTFSPTEEMNKSPDEPVYNLEELVNKGYIKKGGYKNYCLTLYVKLDGITLQNQYLVWKYGGWLFNDQLPDMCRATDVYIPIEGGSNPQIFTEYKHNLFNEIKENFTVNDTPSPILPDGKWVGFQFIRQVDPETKTCTIDVDINTNPVDEDGNFTGKEFKPFLQFEDVNTEKHLANIWAGINEIISISGSKYISLYGVSLYEIES